MLKNYLDNWKKTFFSIWVGRAFCLLGSELAQFALIWYLTEKTDSPTVLAAASFVTLLPHVFLPLINQAFISRWNQQGVMVFSHGLMAGATIIIARILWLGLVDIRYIYLLLFFRAVGSGLQWTAIQAFQSTLVPEKHLVRISSLNRAVRGAVGIIAPLLAAFLISNFLVYKILMVDAIITIIATIPFIIVSYPQAKKNRKKKMDISRAWKDIKITMNFVIAWRGLLYLVVASAIINFLLHPGFTFLPLLVIDHFENGVIKLGVLESAFSVGVIIGGWALRVWRGFKRNIYTTLFGIIGLAAGTGLIAFAPHGKYFLAVIGISLVGFMNPVANGPIFAIMQIYIAPDMRGRVSSLLESTVSVMMPVSMLIAAPVAQWVGIRGWLSFGAIGCLFIGVVGFFMPPLMRIEDERSIYHFD